MRGNSGHHKYLTHTHITCQLTTEDDIRKGSGWLRLGMWSGVWSVECGMWSVDGVGTFLHLGREVGRQVRLTNIKFDQVPGSYVDFVVGLITIVVIAIVYIQLY